MPGRRVQPDTTPGRKPGPLDVRQEGVVDALLGGGPLARVEGQHGREPGRELLRHLRVPLVLVREDLHERPGLEFGDVAELAVLAEELLAVAAGRGDVAGDGSAQLDDVGQVVFIATVVLSCSTQWGYRVRTLDLSTYSVHIICT